MDKILKICKKHNILIIEDAAEVLGLSYKNKKCGSALVQNLWIWASNSSGAWRTVILFPDAPFDTGSSTSCPIKNASDFRK